MNPRSRIAGFAAAAVLAACASVAVRPGAAASASPPIPVFVFAGQSNMVGYRSSIRELASIAPALLSPDRRVLYWGPTDDDASRWAPMSAATEGRGAAAGAGFGPELSAGRALAEAYRGTVAIVKLAVDGTSLARDWNPAAPRSLTTRLVARVRAALASLEDATGSPGALAGMFWMQGETDADDAAAAGSYAATFGGLVRAVRRSLGAASLPVWMARIADTGAHAGQVRAEQARAAASLPGVTLVSTDSLPRDASDPLHLSTRGILALGDLLAARAAR